MTLVAVTMLRSFDRERSEWRDAIDTRWHAFLRRCGLNGIYLPNDVDAAKSLLLACSPDGLILTGGGNCAALTGTLDDRDLCETMAIEWAEAAHRPILGICRGMQVILTRAGAPLMPVLGHVASTHLVQIRGITRTVNSYHNYGFRTAPPSYYAERAGDGVVEAAWNVDRKVLAMMWHPEREPEACSADVELIRIHFGVHQ